MGDFVMAKKLKPYYMDDDKCTGIKSDVVVMKSIIKKALKLKKDFDKIQFGTVSAKNLETFITDMEIALKIHMDVLEE